MANVDVLGFRLEFRDSTQSLAHIYPNGLNQVPVVVSVQLVRPAQVNPDDPTQTTPQQSYILSPEQLFEKLSLCSYPSGEVLSREKGQKGDDGLQQLTENLGYAKAAAYGGTVFSTESPAVEEDGWQQLILFVSATGAGSNGYRIFAQLDLKEENAGFPDAEIIRTDGQGAWNAQLEINTLPAEDYSQSSQWKLDTSSDWVKKGDLTIYSKQKGWVGDNFVKSGDTATSRYRKVYITSTARAQNPALKLQVRSVSGTTISDEVGGMNLRAQPSALFGWGIDNPHYDTIAWWVEPGLEGRHTEGYDTVGFVDGGKCYLQAFNHQYRIYLDDGDSSAVSQSVDSLRDNAITLYQWDIRYANTNIYQDGWSDTVHDATVSVVDNFGNSGKFRITFPSDAWNPVLEFDQTN